MSKTFEGIVESGEIKLKSKVPLPDNTKVIIVVPDFR
ncbi:MAG TPA: antitoxin AF2212-like protein [Blastocatellia bacterium]|nr:antitoxin AF2212-like protein [Blastocatellia bacterium]